VYDFAGQTANKFDISHTNCKMPSCAVAGCSTQSGKRNAKHVHHYKIKNDSRKAQIVHLAGRADKFDIHNMFICSEHYDETDYKRNALGQVITAKNGCPMLTDSAMPHRNLRTKNDATTSTGLTMKVGKRRTLCPFQEGLALSVQCVIEIYTHVQQKFGASYLLTCRLNQDVLENEFSQIRGLGRFYDHPLPSECDYRIRLLSFGNGTISERANTLTRDGTNPLTALFRDASVDGLEGISVPDMFQVHHCVKCRKRDDPSSEIGAHVDYDEMQYQSLRYVAGFLAFKFLHKFPHLGVRTCWISENDLPDWIRAVSRGGLVVPSDNFVQLVQQFDQRFLQFSGKSGLHTCTDSISQLAAKIVRECDCSTIDGSLVLLFARTRSFIRLRFMNAQYESVRLRKRDLKKATTFL
jgi:THAP domain